jgi:2-aminoadipate transaminase
VTYRKPDGGVYIWCRLPACLDAKTVTDACSKAGISIIPGEVFYPSKNGGRHAIRLNYSYETEARLKLGMENLVDIVEKLVREKTR